MKFTGNSLHCLGSTSCYAWMKTDELIEYYRDAFKIHIVGHVQHLCWFWEYFR